MERKAIRNQIGIFTGKQKEYNTQVLTILYDNEPLTAWELTSKMTDTGKQSLHATLNKRLRNLEEKEYIRRKNKKWYLRIKGMIAVLWIQKELMTWNPKWAEIFKKNADTLEEESARELGIDKTKIREALELLGLKLDDFNTYVNLSKTTKELMNKGLINFDVIKEEMLLTDIIMQTSNLKQLSSLFWKKEN